ncbi:MAG: glutamate--tRNA ligase [Thermoanaerobaculia bacterium]|nr:Glutamate--tRNA ligase [Thermoanaerobaculia bacterium]MCK6682257.1 glutamate--tRNA ligase [Thermoanaerobaculia bacterium]
MDSVRVRFAPSPTGSLHVGGARTALYNWLFARRHSGTFILRIEDTDVERSRKELTSQILEAMTWLGLSWDEGPYFQSERYAHYQEAANRLIDEGKAYRAFETPEELEAEKKRAEAEGKAFRYSGACRALSREESDRRAAAGEKFVIRLLMPEETIVVNDVVQGRAEFSPDVLDDFVLVRSDGHPLYHFSVCVDDAAMGITHVIRGVDHLPNTPKHVALFRALGVKPPVFAHLGMILGTDGKKLSKRHGAAGVEEFREMGFLPQALVNFLALLGWSPGEDRERMTTEEMISLFSLERIGPSPSRFDHEKLAWMNGQSLQETPEPELLALLKAPELSALPEETLHAAIGLHRPRTKTLVELRKALSIYLEDPAEFDPAGMKKFARREDAAHLRTLAARLSSIEPFTHTGMEEAARALAEETGLKLGALAQPARLALTGSLASPPLFEMIEVLGKETALRRMLSFAGRIEANPHPH